MGRDLREVEDGKWMGWLAERCTVGLRLVCMFHLSKLKPSCMIRCFRGSMKRFRHTASQILPCAENHRRHLNSMSHAPVVLYTELLLCPTWLASPAHGHVISETRLANGSLLRSFSLCLWNPCFSTQSYSIKANPTRTRRSSHGDTGWQPNVVICNMLVSARLNARQR